MKHQQYNPGFSFVHNPVCFDKYTDRNLLPYCLGTVMYMPGTKDFVQTIVDKSYPGLTSMVMCFEDACLEKDVPAAEIFLSAYQFFQHLSGTAECESGESSAGA